MMPRYVRMPASESANSYVGHVTPHREQRIGWQHKNATNRGENCQVCCMQLKCKPGDRDVMLVMYDTQHADQT